MASAKKQPDKGAQHYDGTPGARSTGVATWQDFSSELDARSAEIASMLPAHVSEAKFRACAVAAVKQNPDLLRCTPRSLFAAITKSAQDGILPDGREGVITAYREEAKWNPMTYGLRKRARELDHILIDAQVVHENDVFVWHQGDSPKIEHQPATLGSPRGEMIGVYAIFKREDGPVLHREVMDRDQVLAVKSQSQAQNSLMWTKFEEEGWRKTVVRRGIKSVPCSESLESIVHRDDENFDFSPPPPDNGVMIPPRPQRSEFERKADAPKPQADKKNVTDVPEGGDGRPEPPPPEGSSEVVTETAPTNLKASAEQPSNEPSADLAKAEKWLTGYLGTIIETEDLAEFKSRGRTMIDTLAGLSDEERDVLRGKFMQGVMEEQRRREKKK